MTDNDDPFGRRDRTIVRPNPRVRRPGGPSLPESPARTLGDPPPTVNSGSVRNARDAAAAEPDPRPGGALPGAAEAVAPNSPRIYEDLVTGATSRIMAAAASPLLLLGRLAGSAPRVSSTEIAAQIARAIEQFEVNLRAADLPTRQVAAAKYALAATADDIMQYLPRQDRTDWAEFRMTSRFFGEGPDSGRFFQELEGAKRNATANLGLLELMHACLSLGYEGKYRARGGAAGLQAERRDLFDVLRRHSAKPSEEFSPNWRGQSIALVGSRFQVPLWSIAAIALAVLFAAYLLMRGTLSTRAGALALDLERVHPQTEIDFVRAEPVKPPAASLRSTSHQSDRIRAALADDIMARQVKVDQTATRLVLTISNRLLFSPGGAKATDGFAPLVQKIAKILDKEPGGIQIDDYSESETINTLAFPSRFELSEARAKSVAAMLRASLARPERVKYAGRGGAELLPAGAVATNGPQKRWVEISLLLGD